MYFYVFHLQGRHYLKFISYLFLGHLLPENWQACLDDATQCYYYWNTVTNEVQWYPPIATIPPPPPPPSNDDIAVEVEETSTGDNSSEIEEPENEVVKNDNASTKNAKREEKVESPIEEESPALKKEKDKELMNQIKERIKRKKEEKLKKEQEDKKKLEKVGEDVNNMQKEKEETLREKLIKKKLERETRTADSKPNENDLELFNDFSVDIFAIGTSGSKRERKDSGTKPDKVLAAKENRSLQNNMSENNSTITSTNILSLIDAGYGDDDDDDDEGDGEENVELKKDTVNKEKLKEENLISQETTPVEKSEKSTENNDNYADMLLEGNN